EEELQRLAKYAERVAAAGRDLSVLSPEELRDLRALSSKWLREQAEPRKEEPQAYQEIGTFTWKGHLIRISGWGDNLDIYPDESAGEPPFPSVTIRGRRDATVELVGLVTIKFGS
ncbi:hypothetical protein LCGC14_2512420, partial [marine sediment metagenome]